MSAAPGNARSFKGLDDLDIVGKTVLVRADLNVPMIDGVVTDDTRIRAVIPTLRAILAARGKVVVMSHFGRPKGKVMPAASLRPLLAPLSTALGQDVAFANNCIGPEAVETIANNQVTLLENLRFHAGEEANDDSFAAALAGLADLCVEDAFSVSHRAHASTEAITRHLPTAAGLAMIAELDALERALAAPVHPVAALVGGAKISTKLDILDALLDKVDYLIIGGAMANTFLFAQGIEIGASLCEKDLKDTASAISARAENSECKIVLPVDAIVAKELAVNVPVRTVGIKDVDTDDLILDIGPDSIKELKTILGDCKTVLWNGPLGAFEIEPFDAGTNEVAREAARLTREGSLLSVAGGGDTVAALNNAGVGGDFSHVSTAGGAFLEWLAGKDLPGVKVLAS